MTSFGILASFLAFVSALGLIFLSLTHYRARVQGFLAREEARAADMTSTLLVEGWSPRRLLHFRFLVTPMVSILVLSMSRSWIFALLVGLLLYIVPPVLMQMAFERRRKRLESQVLDFIGALVASSKAGMNLQQSLQEVTRHLPPPISLECEGILRRVETGQALDSALLETDRRLSLANLSLVVQALVVNERRGGKLPSLLERIGRSLREIERVEERVRTETSGIALSSRIMAAMPIGICSLLYFVSPGHVEMLFETFIGNLLLVFALGLDYLGFALIRRLGQLEV